MSNGVQVVHSNSWFADMLFAKIRKHHEFRLIVSMHGHYEIAPYNSPVYNRITAQWLPNADHVVYLTDAHLKSLRDVDYPAERTSRIFYGYERSGQPTLRSWDGGTALRLVIASRAAPEKGWTQAIDAVIALNTSGNGIFLDLIGDGSELDNLRLKHQACRFMRFHGFQLDVMPYLAAAHVGLLPTYYHAESLPNTVIEYLASGLPVIATDIGAIGQMVDANGEPAGILINGLRGTPVSPKLIQEAILCYCRNPDLVAQHSARASIAFGKFDIEACAASYMSVYRATRCAPRHPRGNHEP
jgi:glycosyltransferase involved in cell wall biosynthesis